MFAGDDHRLIGGQAGDALFLDRRVDGRGSVGLDAGLGRLWLVALVPEHHPVGEALVLVGDGPELVIDDVADQRIGLVAAGPGVEHPLALAAVSGGALAEESDASRALWFKL